MESKKENKAAGFGSMMVGDANALAVRIAGKIVSGAADRYMNPFVVRGCSGTGKTCLLKEIESAVKSRNDGRKVEYIEVYGFFRAYVNALENKAMEDFRAKWESLDVLLLDGFEFLEDCHGISEEMLRLVDGFINSGRQLVIATSADLSALQDDCMARLYNRVRSGVVAELKMPEQGLREACVRSAAKARGVSLPEKTVQEIARKKENFWVLNGLVNSAIAEMS